MRPPLLAHPPGDPFNRYLEQWPATTNTLVQDLHRSMDRILGPNPCQLGISPLCTRDDGYDWQGMDCCAHCLSLVERSTDEGR